MRALSAKGALCAIRRKNNDDIQAMQRVRVLPVHMYKCGDLAGYGDWGERRF